MDRQVRRFLVSAAVSLLAGNMFNYGVIRYAKEVSGSDGFAGLANLLPLVGALLLAPYSGGILDRRPRRSVLASAQGLWVAVAGIIALLALRGGAGPEIRMGILGACFVNGAVYAFAMPARFALMGDLCTPRTKARNSAILNLLVIVGFSLAPVVAGIVAVHGGWSGVFGAVSGLLLLGILVLAGVSGSSPVRAVSVGTEEAWWRNGEAPAIVLAAAAIYLPLGPLQVLIPSYASRALGLGESRIGVLLAFLGFGLLVGGVLAVVAGKWFPRRQSPAILAVGSSLSLACLPLAHDSLGAGVALFLAGAFGGFGAGLLPGRIQERVPEAVRGRVLAAYSMATLLVPAAGGFFAGVVSDRVGISTAFLASSTAVLLVVGLVVVGSRSGDVVGDALDAS